MSQTYKTQVERDAELCTHFKEVVLSALEYLWRQIDVAVEKFKDVAITNEVMQQIQHEVDMTFNIWTKANQNELRLLDPTGSLMLRIPRSKLIVSVDYDDHQQINIDPEHEFKVLIDRAHTFY